MHKKIYLSKLKTWLLISLLFSPQSIQDPELHLCSLDTASVPSNKLQLPELCPHHDLNMQTTFNSS